MLQKSGRFAVKVEALGQVVEINCRGVGKLSAEIEELGVQVEMLGYAG